MSTRHSPLRSALLPLLLAAGLGLSGCSSNPMSGWFGGDESGTPVEGIEAYTEPDPGREAPVSRVWSRSVAGSPDDELLHPTGFEVQQDSVFVGTFQGEVARIARENGRTVWETDLESGIGGGVAADDERVYAGTVSGHMVALDRATGKELWRQRVSTAVASQPTLGSGRLIFTTLDNRTYALDPATGSQLWIHGTPPEPLVVMGAARPAAVGDMVFVGYASGELYALDQRDGHNLWSVNMSVIGGRSELDTLQDVDASPLVMGNVVFTANHRGRLMAIHGRLGQPFWARQVSALRRPLVVNRQMFVSDMQGAVVALNAENGVPFWRTRISDGVLTAPVYHNGAILVADSKERLFSLDPDSGLVTGLTRLGEPVFADPQVVDDQLYLWGNEGTLFRFQ